jgi:hypothetical protein
MITSPPVKTGTNSQIENTNKTTQQTATAASSSSPTEHKTSKKAKSTATLSASSVACFNLLSLQSNNYKSIKTPTPSINKKLCTQL